MPPYRNYIYEYHAKITSGEIIAGKWIKKIYEIIINGLQKQEYFFNAKAANKAIRFIENFCHHSKGRNDLIKLELWQKAIVSVIFGIQDAEKIRIFREIFICICDYCIYGVLRAGVWTRNILLSAEIRPSGAGV